MDEYLQLFQYDANGNVGVNYIYSESKPGKYDPFPSFFFFFRNRVNTFPRVFSTLS